MRRVEEYWIKFVTEKGQTKVKKRWSSFYEWVASVHNAIIIIFILFTFIFRAVGVSGSSMLPTLTNGDWVAVTGISFEPQRGDIVVITQPNMLNEPLIKRVIAVGGDTININYITGEVVINGETINEPYIFEATHSAADWDIPTPIPDGFVFVMGDNRNDSWDSRKRSVGLIDERYILGEAKLRLFPFGKWSLG